MVRIIEQYNDKLAIVYDKATVKEFKWWAAKEATRVLLPSLKKPSNILDLGIGTGQSSQEFYRQGHKIVGIDISKEMLEVVNKNFPKIKTYQWDVEKGISDLRFGKNSFDAVLAVGVLEFIEKLDYLIRDVKIVLKVNGYLCVAFEEYIDGHKFQGKRISKLGYGLVDKIPKLLSFRVYRRTKGEVEDVFKSLGFEIVITKRFTGYLKSAKKVPVKYAMVLARRVRIN